MKRSLVLTFAMVGLVSAAAAAYVHYKVLRQPGYISPCDISARFSCSDVYRSRYGSVAGVPVAFGGVWFFGIVVAIAAFARPVPRALFFVLSLVGVAAALYFASISIFVLETGCVLCIGTYVSAVGPVAAAFAGSSLRPPWRGLRSELAILTRQRRVVTALAAWCVAVSVSASAFPRELDATETAPKASATAVPFDDRSPEEQRFDAAWAEQPRVNLGIPADGAKVVIVKFNDWQCSACKATFYGYQSILDTYAASIPGAIKYVTKDFPLNTRCNFAIGVSLHPAACEAAAAVRMASEHGKADEMEQWLFANQESLTPAIVAKEATRRLSESDFAAGYARLLPEIKRDIADGTALHLTGTPAYFVNGVRAHAENGASIPPQYFDYAIRYELNATDRK